MKPKFTSGQLVRHIKGGIYSILITPPTCYIETNKIPAYVYFDNQGNTWIRPQSEMEDGRFSLYVRDEDNTTTEHLNDRG